jgi:hypothetical protein
MLRSWRERSDGTGGGRNRAGGWRLTGRALFYFVTIMITRCTYACTSSYVRTNFERNSCTHIAAGGNEIDERAVFISSLPPSCVWC